MSKRGLFGVPTPVLIIVILIIIALAILGLIGGSIGKVLFSGINIPWLNVPQPEPSLPAEEVFSLFGFPIANSILGAWITIVIVTLLCWGATRRMKLVPGRFQAAFEFLVGWIYDLCVRIAGDKNGRRFFPVVATIFLFVGFNAWLSLLPGFGSIWINNPEGVHVPLLRGANTDINMPLALALVSFIFVEYNGVRALGIGYLSKFVNVGPLIKTIGGIFKGHFTPTDLISGIVAVFVGVLEALSEVIRILSLTFRLFGNMTAGEILLLITAFLIPFVVSDVFYGLELLIGFVQALIFSGLTLVYVTMAVAAHGEHSEHSEHSAEAH